MTIRHRVDFNGYDGYTPKQFIKCFEVALDMPHFRNVAELYLYYDRNRFVTDTEVGYNSRTFMAAFHYPGQFLLALDAIFDDWASVYPIAVSYTHLTLPTILRV